MFEIKTTEQEYVSGGAPSGNDDSLFQQGAQGLDNYFWTLGIETFFSDFASTLARMTNSTSFDFNDSETVISTLSRASRQITNSIKNILAGI